MYTLDRGNASLLVENGWIVLNVREGKDEDHKDNIEKYMKAMREIFGEDDLNVNVHDARGEVVFCWVNELNLLLNAILADLGSISAELF